jgi:hypothetical protein
VTVSAGVEQLPLLELGGGWSAALLTSDQWNEAVSTGPLQRFASFNPSTPLADRLIGAGARRQVNCGLHVQTGD